MPSCNPFFWVYSSFRTSVKNHSPPNPVGPNDGDGIDHGVQQAFGADGMVNGRNMVNVLTRVDGEAGEAIFDGNPAKIIEFLDQILEVGRILVHSANGVDLTCLL